MLQIGESNSSAPPADIKIGKHDHLPFEKKLRHIISDTKSETQVEHAKKVDNGG
jgi:hypothetical protein